MAPLFKKAEDLHTPISFVSAEEMCPALFKQSVMNYTKEPPFDNPPCVLQKETEFQAPLPGYFYVICVQTYVLANGDAFSFTRRGKDIGTLRTDVGLLEIGPHGHADYFWLKEDGLCRTSGSVLSIADGDQVYIFHTLLHKLYEQKKDDIHILLTHDDLKVSVLTKVILLKEQARVKVDIPTGV